MENLSNKDLIYLDVNFVAEMTTDIIDFDISNDDNLFLNTENDFLDSNLETNLNDVEVLAEHFLKDLIDEYGLGEGSFKCQFNTIATADSLKVLCSSDNESTIAIIHMNITNNKIRMEFLDSILPMQEYNTPEEINKKIIKLAKNKNWQTEYGGRNQFNGNIEIRYKDIQDKAMAAIISTPSGHIETVVEYKYKNDKKSHMIQTGEFGKSITTYDTKGEHIQNTSIDIDTCGNITSITKRIDNYMLFLSGYDTCINEE